MRILMMPEGWASVAQEDNGDRRYYEVQARIYLDPHEKNRMSDIEQVARCCTHDDACIGFRTICVDDKIVIARIFLEHKGHAVAHLPEVPLQDNDLERALIRLGRHVLEYYIQSHCYDDEAELAGVKALLAWTK